MATVPPSLQHPTRAPERPQPSGWAREEHTAWRRLYRDVGTVRIATAIMAHFALDAEGRRFHLALYLHAQVTLARHEARVARSRRAVATLIRVCRAPWQLVKRAATACGFPSPGAAPSARNEPAVQRVAVLDTDPRFAEARRRFNQEADLAFPPLDSVADEDASAFAQAA